MVMVKHKNCLNCGAPIPKNGRCEYCGTVYDNYEIPVEAKKDADAVSSHAISDLSKYVRVFDDERLIWVWRAGT